MCVVMTMYSILDNLEKYKKALLFGVLGPHKKSVTMQMKSIKAQELRTKTYCEVQVGAEGRGLAFLHFYVKVKAQRKQGIALSMTCIS